MRETPASGKRPEDVKEVVEEPRRAFVEPKLTYVEPELVNHGHLVDVTGFFGTFTP